MADQPSYKQLEPCDFFADGRSERPAVAGTVARGHLQTDVALFTGRRTGKDGEPLGAAHAGRRAAAARQPAGSQGPARRSTTDFVDSFPFPMTEEVLEHGYKRYMIYCVVCHDPVGHGQGQDRGARLHARRRPITSSGCATCRSATCSPSSARATARCRPTRPKFPCAIAGPSSATCGRLQASQHFPEAEAPLSRKRPESRQPSGARLTQPSPREGDIAMSNATPDADRTADWPAGNGGRCWSAIVALVGLRASAPRSARRRSSGPIWRPICSIWASRWARWCC